MAGERELEQVIEKTMEHSTMRVIETFLILGNFVDYNDNSIEDKWKAVFFS